MLSAHKALASIKSYLPTKSGFFSNLLRNGQVKGVPGSISRLIIGLIQSEKKPKVLRHSLLLNYLILSVLLIDEKLTPKSDPAGELQAYKVYLGYPSVCYDSDSATNVLGIAITATALAKNSLRCLTSDAASTKILCWPAGYFDQVRVPLPDYDLWTEPPESSFELAEH